MKKTVLIIDDSPNILRLLQYNLSTQYQVLTAEDGQKGLDKLNSGSIPDLIVADVAMPNLDGFEFLKKIRGKSEYKGIPVIILSAKSQSTDRIQGLKLGADDYMTKPFNPEELVIRIDKILARA